MSLFDYSVSITALLVGAVLYLYVAGKAGIYDVPNSRSSHQKKVIRGAGIIFLLALLLHQWYYDFSLPYLLFGATLLALISFLDDLTDLDSRLRMVVQLVSVTLVCVELNLLIPFQPWIIPLILFGVMLLNAYNFMDGINGITGIYSIVFFTSLICSTVPLASDEYALGYLLLAALGIFGFYNFRNQARAFAGDVGSTFMGLVMFYFTIKIIADTSDISFVLLLLVYGVDSLWTVVARFRKGENIFKAHRSHLYQILSNEYGWPHLKVSVIYGLIQLVINAVVLINYHYAFLDSKIFTFSILIVASVVYLFTRNNFYSKL